MSMKNLFPINGKLTLTLARSLRTIDGLLCFLNFLFYLEDQPRSTPLSLETDGCLLPYTSNEVASIRLRQLYKFVIHQLNAIKACGTPFTSSAAPFLRRRWYRLTPSIITLTLTQHPLIFAAPCFAHKTVSSPSLSSSSSDVGS